jgi:hypothetical protein
VLNKEQVSRAIDKLYDVFILRPIRTNEKRCTKMRF